MPTVAFTWTTGKVEASDGWTVEGVVGWEVPAGTPLAEQLEGLRDMVARTKAYGLLLIERRDRGIYALFETHHGAKAWMMPFKPHGDVTLLGPTEVRENADCVGLLWRPGAATS